MTPDQIVGEARRLPRGQSAELFDRLLAAADDTPDPELAPAGEIETRRRKLKAFRFSRDALAEAKVAAERDATISPGRGRRFDALVDRLLREIGAPPTLDRAFDPPARRHVRRPFPPAVIDIDRPDHVRIVAVASRNMRRRKKRVGSTRSLGKKRVGSTRSTLD